MFVICTRYDLARAGRQPYNLNHVPHVFLGLDLCDTDTVQHIITAG